MYLGLEMTYIRVILKYSNKAVTVQTVQSILYQVHHYQQYYAHAVPPISLLLCLLYISC